MSKPYPNTADVRPKSRQSTPRYAEGSFAHRWSSREGVRGTNSVFVTATDGG